MDQIEGAKKLDTIIDDMKLNKSQIISLQDENVILKNELAAHKEAHERKYCLIPVQESFKVDH